MTLRADAHRASLAFMMVNKPLLAVILTAGALGAAAGAAARPALGLPPAAHVSYQHGRAMLSRHGVNRYQRYGAYGYWGGYYGSPYAAVADAEPIPPPIAETPAVAPAAYHSGAVCPVVWRWSARAGQAVRSWSYCNN